jgi:hypothetical protein
LACSLKKDCCSGAGSDPSFLKSRVVRRSKPVLQAAQEILVVAKDILTAIRHDRLTASSNKDRMGSGGWWMGEAAFRERFWVAIQEVLFKEVWQGPWGVPSYGKNCDFGKNNDRSNRALKVHFYI